MCNQRIVEYEKIQQILPELRSKESNIASDLQINSINLDNQEKEIERANNAVEEIQIRINQINDDVSREQFLLNDANENLIRVKEEKSILEKSTDFKKSIILEELTFSRSKLIINLLYEGV